MSFNPTNAPSGFSFGFGAGTGVATSSVASSSSSSRGLGQQQQQSWLFGGTAAAAPASSRPIGTKSAHFWDNARGLGGVPQHNPPGSTSAFHVGSSSGFNSSQASTTPFNWSTTRATEAMGWSSTPAIQQGAGAAGFGNAQAAAHLFQPSFGTAPAPQQPAAATTLQVGTVTFGSSPPSDPVPEITAVFDPPPALDDASLERVLSVAAVTRAQIDELDERAFSTWEQQQARSNTPADGAWSSSEWSDRWGSADHAAAASIEALGLRELHFLLLQMGVAPDALRKMSRGDKHRTLESLLPKCRAVVRHHRQMSARKHALNAAERAALLEQAEALIRTGRLDSVQDLPPIVEFGSASASAIAASSSSPSAAAAAAAAVRPDGMDADDWMDLSAVASAVIVRKEGVSVSMLRDVLQWSPWVMLDAEGMRARRRRRAELVGNEFGLLNEDEAVIGAHALGAIATGKPLTAERLFELMKRELSGWTERRVLQSLRLNTAIDAASSSAATFVRLTPEQQKQRLADFTLVPDCARSEPCKPVRKAGVSAASGSSSSSSSSSSPSPLPLPDVCAFRASAKTAPSFGERAIYIQPARVGGTEPDVAAPVSSSCSFSIRVLRMLPFNRLRIGFRQNSLFAQTHLLQLCFATEGAPEAPPGHGEICSLHNARRPRLHSTEPDSECLFESDEEPASGSLPLPPFAAAPVVPVDPAVPNAASFRVLVHGGVAWSMLFLPLDPLYSVRPFPFRLQVLQRVDPAADPSVVYLWSFRGSQGEVAPSSSLHAMSPDDAKVAMVHEFYNITESPWTERATASSRSGAQATWVDESDPSKTSSSRRSLLASAASAASSSSISSGSSSGPARAPVHGQSKAPPVATRTVSLPPLTLGSVLTCRYDESRAEIRFALNGEELPDATIGSVLTRHAHPADWDVSALHAMLPILLVHGDIETECVPEEAGLHEAEMRRHKADSVAASALSSLHQRDASAMVAGVAALPPLRDLSAALATWSASERALSSASSSERDNHNEGLVPCAASALPGLLRLLFHDYDISRAIGLPYLSVALIDLVHDYLQMSAPRTGTRQFGFMRFWALMLRGRHAGQQAGFFGSSYAATTVAWLFHDQFPFQSKRGLDMDMHARKRPVTTDVMSDGAPDVPALCVYHDLVGSGLRSKLYSDPNWRATARSGGGGFGSGDDSPPEVERELVPTEGDSEGYESMFVRFASKHPDQLRFEDYSSAERAREEHVLLYGDLDPSWSSGSSSSVSHAALLDRHFGGGVALDEDGKWLGKVDFATVVPGGGFKVGSSLRFGGGANTGAAAVDAKEGPRTLDPSAVTFGALPSFSHFPLPPVGVSWSDETPVEFVDQSCLRQMIRAAAAPPSLAEIQAHLSDVCGAALIDEGWNELRFLAAKLIREKFGTNLV